MPLTADMRRSIDQIRDYLFGGGYPDPVSNTEQLCFLFYFYLIQGLDAEATERARMLKLPFRSLFEGEWELRNPANAMVPGTREGWLPAAVLHTGTPCIPRSRFRWSVWAEELSGDALVRFVRDEVFPFFAEISEALAHDFMHGARLGIDEPTVLTQVVRLVGGLRLDQADADTKGDLFEHVLRQMKQAGELGQFRTPRHILRTIVEMVDPKVGETVYDPAAGTAGFLVAAYNHMRLANSSPGSIVEAELEGKVHRRGLGDRLTPAQVATLQRGSFFGNDVDPKMVRLATMNLSLRGLGNVRILQRNVLTTQLDEDARNRLGQPAEGFHIVLANPPFSGRIDKNRIVDAVKIGATSATELLFLKYMLDSLQSGGRAAVVVPEGVLFGSTVAHRELRRQLIEHHGVDAVMSLPGGVFQPYSGVKTSVLFFRRDGRTDRVLFLHVENDGYRLDANHDTPIEADDLPALAQAFIGREAAWARWLARDAAEEWNEKWWFADATALRTNDFSLSASRYRPMSQSQIEHQDPRALLDELAAIEAEIVEELEQLRSLLSEDDA
ncbi:class I SAM-dependent DNA methyltransferase [Variovorax sp. JS1663]|uniref:class I SAM-dependent DNA methyltransferase n=1 Tax=Variovorax sp. JS1663 TaxID=1851577 RepID=UPI000B349419|nr:class I SAM-dependent DNA methyltransferase [Variovorax sp. JS1663]OUM03225.1 restriction endonuclease subunit S [Variovorax sp. JS1663]